MSRWLLALVLAAAGLPGATAHDALGAIDACLAQLDRGLDVGYRRIAARCPDLAPSLMQSQWAAWLPRDWNQPENLLSADRKSTRLNSSHDQISYAVFCLKKKKKKN